MITYLITCFVLLFSVSFHKTTYFLQSSQDLDLTTLTLINCFQLIMRLLIALIFVGYFLYLKIFRKCDMIDHSLTSVEQYNRRHHQLFRRLFPQRKSKYFFERMVFLYSPWVHIYAAALQQEFLEP